MVYVVLAAFAAQGLLTQGHWHSVGAGIALASDSSALGEPTGQQPPKGDQNNCPICHAASVAGQFFAPATFILSPPSLSTLLKPRGKSVIVVTRIAAHWQSRAPPAV